MASQVIKPKEEAIEMEKRLSLGLPLGILFAATMIVIALTHFNPAMAATITVTHTDDSGAGSLREAIASAAPGDTINLDVTGTITLTTGELLINTDLTISGPGAESLAISGNNASRVFKIFLSKTVTISGLTIQNGNVPTGQGAGGIMNWGTLTLNNVVVKNNTVNGTDTSDVGGGIKNGGNGPATMTINNSTVTGNTADRGGGIFNAGSTTLFLNNSTISDNTAGGGGGITIYGTATLTNVTISGNTATGSAGGILNEAIAALTNVTISGNTAHPAHGGGVTTSGAITLSNSIVANSISGPNCVGTITSKDYNLSSDNTCGFAGTGDLNNTDPLLGPLQDNGGPTFTHALLSGSPAIDAGDPTHSIAFDQRGVTRPQGAHPDIGAFELGLAAKPEEGTIGTEMTIFGYGFGTKKGKVLIGNATLKILDWAEGSIECLLTKKLSPDTYDITIRPPAKGVSPSIVPDGFTVRIPAFEGLDPTTGTTGDEIRIIGSFFGTKKGKVTLGGKNCKVLSWTMDPPNGQSEIRFIVPKGLSSGTQELKVINKVGEGTVNFTVE